MVKKIQWGLSPNGNDYTGRVGDVQVCFLLRNGTTYTIHFAIFNIDYSIYERYDLDIAMEKAEQYYTDYVNDFLDKFTER